MKKILLVANSYWYIHNFRLSLIKELQKNNYEINIVCPKEKSENFSIKGVNLINWKLSRKSINPFLELESLVNLIKIYKKEKPHLVHHFTIKACLYGTISAKFSKVQHVINAVTGLGHLFLGNGRKHQLMRFLIKPIYKTIFTAKRSNVIFQNADDQDELLSMGFIKKKNSNIIKGSGVDINFFKPFIDNAGIFDDPIKLLFPSRLIKEKGLIETVEACQILWKKHFKIILYVAGAIDEGNRSALTKKELELLKNEKRIKLLDFVEDMKEMYSRANIVILPSWREGLSKTLIEASSMEKPIITTDVPGCRDIIEHGVNGILVPKRDSEALALAIEFMIENPPLARTFGKRCREKVRKEFEIKKINEQTLKVYENCFKGLDNK